MFQYLLSKWFGSTPDVHKLPYHQRAYIITLSTAVERVK